MYNCQLQIQIYSNNGLLEEAIKQIPPLENFEQIVFRSDVISSDSLKNRDIIILDFEVDKDTLDLILKSKKNDALTVYCVLPEEISSISSYFACHAFDRTWLKPFDRDTIFSYFLKIQQQIKLKMDYNLTQKYLDVLINSIPDLVWFKDLKGLHLKVNDSFCRTVGKTKEDIQGREHYYIWNVDKEEYEAGVYVCKETDEIVIREKRMGLFDEQVKSTSGLRQFKTYKSPIFGDDGEPIGTVGVGHDVTDLGNAYAELEIVIENMPFAILIYDAEGIVLNVNNNFTEYFNITREAMIGSTYTSWEAKTFKDKTINDNDQNFEAELYIGSELRHFNCYKKPILDIFGNIFGYVCTFADITEEYSLKEKLLTSANTDALTGLYNRRSLYYVISNMRDGAPVSLLYLDIDNFKMINDTYGHKVGDQLLIDFSEILLNMFPGNKIFRLGGDEFLITLLNISDIDIAKEYAQRLLTACENYFFDKEKPIQITVSIGIALDNNSTLPLEDLIKKGDNALYMAKRNGKNQFYS